MTDRPHSVMLRCSDNRRFASSLVTEDAVFGVEMNGEQIVVKTSDLMAFAHLAPRLARDAGVTLYELSPTDESLESVFSYLVRR